MGEAGRLYDTVYGQHLPLHKRELPNHTMGLFPQLLITAGAQTLLAQGRPAGKQRLTPGMTCVASVNADKASQRTR